MHITILYRIVWYRIVGAYHIQFCPTMQSSWQQPHCRRFRITYDLKYRVVCRMHKTSILWLDVL